MAFLDIMCECLSLSRSVLRGVCHILFSVYQLFGKNLIIFVAAFILDVGRVMFGRGCTKLRVFMYNILIDLFNKVLCGKITGFCIFS